MRPPTVTPVDSGSILASSTVQGASAVANTHTQEDRTVSKVKRMVNNLVRAFSSLRKILCGARKFKSVFFLTIAADNFLYQFHFL